MSFSGKQHFSPSAQQTKTQKGHKVIWCIFHKSDPWISRDNSRVVQVNADYLIRGLGPSLFHEMNTGFYMRNLFFSHLLKIYIFFNLGSGVVIYSWFLIYRFIIKNTEYKYIIITKCLQTKHFSFYLLH